MGVTVPFLDAITYPAKWIRRLTNLLAAEGILPGQYTAADCLKVQAKGTPDMSVDVLAGDCVISGDNTADYGSQLFNSDSTVNKAIAASNPSNPRIDIVCTRFYDDGTVPGSYGELVVVTGTPAGSPSVPATPTNAYKLAEIAVAAGATTITNANITDKRTSTAFIRNAGFLTADIANAQITLAKMAAASVDQTKAPTLLLASQYQTTVPANTAVTNQRVQRGHVNCVWPNSSGMTPKVITLETAFANTDYCVFQNENVTDANLLTTGIISVVAMLTTSFTLQGWDPVATRNLTERRGWIAMGTV